MRKNLTRPRISQEVRIWETGGREKQNMAVISKNQVEQNPLSCHMPWANGAHWLRLWYMKTRTTVLILYTQYHQR